MERQRQRKSVDGDHDDEASATANTGMIELPEGCIATVISFTSPRDACRLSCVNSLFKLATESDAVWDRFFPTDYRSLISNSNFCSLSSSMSKKELYLSLCHNPILIDEGKMSFQLDKLSGKKCYMVSARFPEVRELIRVRRFKSGCRGEKNALEMSVREITISNWKASLIVQGIEIKPKQSK
ncbi:hypothetical protein JRO89_XS04G0045200 [Xanthoceras sorbifolium]|uniref:F-box domain-containing protein n=1 Tax=Xanthoceras sorbifolium TaxID=99658 RepID=A0ABQ8I448_9ROSI|nr:hypothetical protein JRO89_XS04G0045200 [Xanthoceras sorbifolium]